MFTEYARTSEFFKIKGGYLGETGDEPAEVKSLADLPPLPVMRARLLGTVCWRPPASLPAPWPSPLARSPLSSKHMQNKAAPEPA